MFGRDLFSPINFQVEDEMPSGRERYGEAFWRAHHEAWGRSELNQRVLRGSGDSPQGVRQLADEVQGRATTAGAQGALSARRPESCP